ncbi:MAG: spermidine synthase [Alphaproteobacteria bacterium]
MNARPFCNGLAALVCAAFLLTPAPPAMADDSKELLYRTESVYNTIFVFKEGPYRILKFGYKRRHYHESTYNPDDPTELPAKYTQYTTAGLAYADKLEKAVVIGMGGGRITWYLSHFIPEMEVTGVELDPKIVRIAGEYFDVQEGPNLKIVTRDGRIFMRRTKERYDYIVVDAYRGAFVPFHLLTQEFYQLLEERLEPGGVVVQNIEPRTMLFDYALATIGSVFDTVDLYKAGGNIVAVAHNGPRKSLQELLKKALPRHKDHKFRYRPANMVHKRMPPQSADPKKVLTDDFAPANYLKAVKAHNRRWDK